MNVNFVVASLSHGEKPDLAIVMQDEQVGGALLSLLGQAIVLCTLLSLRESS